jgi:hypothetical protein
MPTWWMPSHDPGGPKNTRSPAINLFRSAIFGVSRYCVFAMRGSILPTWR